MGITIEEFEEYAKAHNIIPMTREFYENRLKADLEAILVDLQLDVEGQKFDTHIGKDVWNDAIRVCSELIQQRINELKGK